MRHGRKGERIAGREEESSEPLTNLVTATGTGRMKNPMDTKGYGYTSKSAKMARNLHTALIRRQADLFTIQTQRDTRRQKQV